MSLFATLVSVFLAVFYHILFCIYLMFVQIISMVLGDTLFNYRTQVSLGSDLWVRLSLTDSLTHSKTFVKLMQVMLVCGTLPWIALLALSVSIELVSSSARVTSVKSAQGK